MVVIDGITIGHPCCASPNCMVPLENNHHHFCPVHHDNDKVCSIVGCHKQVTDGRLTCTLADHHCIENAHNLHGQSHFQLQQRLEHAHHLDDTNVGAITGDEETFKIAEDGRAWPATMTPAETHQGGAATKQNKQLCAQFRCWHTFCQEIMVAPCGLMGYQTTFYGAEGVASVVVTSLSLYMNRH